MRPLLHALACGAALIALGAPLLAQSKSESAKAKRGPGDPEVIEFFYPGNFQKMRAAATERNHAIVIKGVAFGVDKVGATCATKGHW